MRVLRAMLALLAVLLPVKLYPCATEVEQILAKTSIKAQIAFADQLVALRLAKTLKSSGFDPKLKDKTAKVLPAYLNSRVLLAKLCFSLEEAKLKKIWPLLAKDLSKGAALEGLFAQESVIYSLAGQTKLKGFLNSQAKKSTQVEPAVISYNQLTLQHERNLAIAIGLSRGFLIAMQARRQQDIDIDKISYYQRKVVGEQN